MTRRRTRSARRSRSASTLRRLGPVPQRLLWRADSGVRPVPSLLAERASRVGGAGLGTLGRRRPVGRGQPSPSFAAYASLSSSQPWLRASSPRIGGDRPRRRAAARPRPGRGASRRRPSAASPGRRPCAAGSAGCRRRPAPAPSAAGRRPRCTPAGVGGSARRTVAGRSSGVVAVDHRQRGGAGAGRGRGRRRTAPTARSCAGLGERRPHLRRRVPRSRTKTSVQPPSAGSAATSASGPG